ncbi:immunity protein Imm33 domain-containing protein [Massilia sp. BKSP1R2A-1]|uniref:immunity protein Imm33 domain-containing protein n=1 Tax=Massilia sp. BKSP1R2A-1 TaxID=3422595 RepID=UPI003D338D0B
MSDLKRPFTVPVQCAGLKGGLIETQEEVCARFGEAPAPPGAGEKLGVALSTMGALPINGLRIRLEGTCGWFIWAGEQMSVDSGFYQPLHVEHIAEYLPSVTPYLSLPPGYRFQIADEYEDVWFDPALLSER